MADKDEITLPKATVNRLIKESLPKDVKCTAQSQELILQCCLEFLQLLSSESNDICNQKNKKTISGEHVVEAVKKLGFNDYAPELQQILEEHKKTEATRPKSESKNKLRNSGFTHEELLKQQQELFAQAKSAVQATGPAQPLSAVGIQQLNANGSSLPPILSLNTIKSLSMPDISQPQ